MNHEMILRMVKLTNVSQHCQSHSVQCDWIESRAVNDVMIPISVCSFFKRSNIQTLYNLVKEKKIKRYGFNTIGKEDEITVHFINSVYVLVKLYTV